MQSLRNQRILIIGGSSGIGLATAVGAIAAGATVTIASRNQEKLDAAAATLDDVARTALLDTGDNALVEKFFQQEEPWDHIVISAAQTKGGPVRSLSLGDAEAAMESKFWGAYRVARAARLKAGHLRSSQDF